MLAAGVSAVLAVFAVLSWVRSCFYSDSLAVHREGIVLFSAASHGGHFWCRFYAERPRGQTGNPPLTGPRTLWTESLRLPFGSGLFPGISPSFLGFAWEHEGLRSYVRGQRFRQEYWGVQIPYWFLFLLFLVCPGRMLWKRVRRRRLPSQCPACGYDLRATPERCPECGTAAGGVVR
jgi:hypothetical protein